MKKIRKLLSAVLSTAIIAASAVCGISISAETSAAAIKATPLTDWSVSRNWQFVGASDHATVQPLGFTSAYGLKIKAATGKGTGVDFGKINSSNLYIGVKYEAGNYRSLSESSNGIILYLKTETANDMVLNVLFDRNGTEREFAPKVGSSYQYAALGDDSWTDATAEAGGRENSVFYGSFGFDGPFEGYVKVPFTSLVRDSGGEIDLTQDMLREVKLKFKTLGETYETGAIVGPVMIMTEDSASVKIEVPEEYRTAPVQATPITGWTMLNNKSGYVTPTVVSPVGHVINADGVKLSSANGASQDYSADISKSNVLVQMQYREDNKSETNGEFYSLPSDFRTNGTLMLYVKTDSANKLYLVLQTKGNWSYLENNTLKLNGAYKSAAIGDDKWTEKTVSSTAGNDEYNGLIEFEAAFEGFIKIPATSIKWNGTENIGRIESKFAYIGGDYGDVTAGPFFYVTSDSASPEIEVPAEYRPSPINVNSVEFKSAINGAYAFSANPVENGYSLSISDSVLSEDEVKFVGGENGTKKWSYVEADDANIGGSGLTNLKMAPKLPLAPRDVDGFIVYLKTESANAFAFQLTYEKGTHWTKNWFPEMHLIPGKTVMVKASSSSRWEEKTVDVGRTGNTSIYGAVKFDSAFDGYIKIPYSSIGRDDSWKPYTTVEDGAIDRITEVVFRFKGVGGKLENGLYGNVTAGLVGYFTEDSTSVEMNVDKPAYLTGDVNNDCFRDSKDLIQLRKYLLGVEAEINPEYANVDESEDQQVNIIDLVRLKKLISNME